MTANPPEISWSTSTTIPTTSTIVLLPVAPCRWVWFLGPNLRWCAMLTQIRSTSCLPYMEFYQVFDGIQVFLWFFAFLWERSGNVIHLRTRFHQLLWPKPHCARGIPSMFGTLLAFWCSLLSGISIFYMLYSIVRRPMFSRSLQKAHDNQIRMFAAETTTTTTSCYYYYYYHPPSPCPQANLSVASLEWPTERSSKLARRGTCHGRKEMESLEGYTTITGNILALNLSSPCSTISSLEQAHQSTKHITMGTNRKVAEGLSSQIVCRCTYVKLYNI